MNFVSKEIENRKSKALEDVLWSIVRKMEVIRDLNSSDASSELITKNEEECKSMIKSFLENKGDINMRFSEKESTMLHVAGLYNLTNLAQFLIDNGANVNVQNSLGETTLIESAFNVEIAKLLTKNNADLNIKNKENKTAFQKAIDIYWKDFIIFILKNHPEQKETLDKKQQERLQKVLDFYKENNLSI